MNNQTKAQAHQQSAAGLPCEPTIIDQDSTADAFFGGGAASPPPLVIIGKMGETKKNWVADPDDVDPEEVEDAAKAPKPEIPAILMKFQGLVPEAYSACYTERCFQGTRYVETTRTDKFTLETSVKSAVKRFICKSKRCRFCFAWLSGPVLKAKLRSVPLTNAIFVTYTHDQELLKSWNISSRAAEKATGIMLGYVHDWINRITPTSAKAAMRPWQYFIVTESHRSGWPHNHGLYRDVPDIDTIWQVGAERIIQSGELRGRNTLRDDGGYWATTARHFFHRAYSKDARGTGRKIPGHHARRFWDFEKVMRVHILECRARGVDEPKKWMVSTLRERIRKNKPHEGREHLVERYQRQLALVEADVPVTGCLCHPDSTYYEGRACHDQREEYRSLLIEELLQIPCTHVGMGDVHVLPIFDKGKTVTYILKEFSKESQQNTGRPKNVPVYRQSKQFFREYIPPLDDATYRQQLLKGDDLTTVVNRLRAQHCTVGREETVQRDGSEILFSQDFIPSDGCLVEFDRLQELLPIIKRNLRWDYDLKVYRQDGESRPRILVCEGHTEVYWPLEEKDDAGIVRRTIQAVRVPRDDGPVSERIIDLDRLTLGPVFSPSKHTQRSVDLACAIQNGNLEPIMGKGNKRSGDAVLMAWHGGELYEFDGGSLARRTFAYFLGEWITAERARVSVTDALPSITMPRSREGDLFAYMPADIDGEAF